MFCSLLAPLSFSNRNLKMRNNRIVRIVVFVQEVIIAHFPQAVSGFVHDFDEDFFVVADNRRGFVNAPRTHKIDAGTPLRAARC